MLCYLYLSNGEINLQICSAFYHYKPYVLGDRHKNFEDWFLRNLDIRNKTYQCGYIVEEDDYMLEECSYMTVEDHCHIPEEHG